MAEVNINFKTWSHFRPNNLFVSEDVLGQSVFILYKGKNVEIRIPGLETHKERDIDAEVTSWQKSGLVGEALTPSYYAVQCLYILVDNNSSIRLDERVKERNPNCYEFIADGQQKKLNEFARSGQNIAEEIFENFSRAVRWLTDDPTVCRAFGGDGKNSDSRILENGTEKTIWIGGDRVIYIGGEPIVTRVGHRA